MKSVVNKTFNPQTDAASVAVIGAGAAGLLAGCAAARAGARTAVYERMAAPGRKLALAGGGRCNFSNTLNSRDFVRRFGDKNAAKLGQALRAFSNEDLIALLARRGVAAQLEGGYRLFTRSGRGEDVVRALARELEEAGGRLECQARITALTRAADGFLLSGRFGGRDEQRRARTVIVCTGGLSYPATGSSGDGFTWARLLGHTVTSLRAALVGLVVKETWPAELQGLSWPDAAVTLRRPGHCAGKTLGAERGEILFTHFGLSGPAILDLSNQFAAAGLAEGRLELDFFPELPLEELREQLRPRFEKFPNRTPANALAGFRQVPARLLEHWQRALGPDGAQPLRRFPKAARARLLGLMKQTALTVAGTRGVEHGEVTAGGVSWSEIDPATLVSRRCPGLFFAGETLDVAGRCGGFNLQAAFSTGFLAGQSAARLALGKNSD